jgi:hypothetical protein
MKAVVICKKIQLITDSLALIRMAKRKDMKENKLSPYKKELA